MKALKDAPLLEREKTQMEIIREGLFQKHEPGEQDTRFADAIYSLFREYTNDYYREEWDRIDDNERIYQGNHWEGQAPEAFGDPRQPNMPKPSTPIITSTIENLKADLSDEFPEAVIRPDGVGNEVLAKVLTTVLAEELEACDFEQEYSSLVHDVLNCGWGVWEIGYDPDLNNGVGGSYIRYIVNKNWLCDPQAMDIQDGRAVFKVARRPRDWFLQHYPDHYPFMRGDNDLVRSDHDDFGATTAPSDRRDFRLIEAWFRVYDPETHKHSVHFVKLAGGQVLENSAESRPEGYYSHGLYPFEVCRLFPQKGSALGLGITDLFKDAQRFSDKLDQILLVNAFRASRPRIFIQKDLVDYDDARDFSKEVIETTGDPNAAVQWQQPQPLPSYAMTYIQMIRDSIKTESGSNDQSRGQTSSGVTAASAITALQEMSTKRSRMEGRAIHSSFRKAVRMQIDMLREFAVNERQVPVTVNGERLIVPFSRKFMLDMDNRPMPIEHYITVKTARQTKYTKLMHNELMLQMLQVLGDTVDPVIMMEGLEYDGLEPLLENVRRAQRGGMLALQKQVAQLTQAVEQLTQERDGYRNTAEQMRAAMVAQGAQETQAQQATGYDEPSAEMAQAIT